MGIFSRKASREHSLQIPDELALKAANQAASGDPFGALNTYGEAVDKIHTMSVVAQPSSRIRRPSVSDQGILDGFNSSLGAVLSADPHAGVSATVERTIGYLREIADEAGPESGRYRAAIEAVQATYNP